MKASSEAVEVGVEREFHPVANLFPMLQAEQLAELVEDIRVNGLKEPIWLDDAGQIIDGRNRYRACRRRPAD